MITKIEKKLKYSIIKDDSLSRKYDARIWQKEEQAWKFTM